MRLGDGGIEGGTVGTTHAPTGSLPGRRAVLARWQAWWIFIFAIMSDKAALIIGATVEEYSQIKESLLNWKSRNIQLSDLETVVSSLPEMTKVAILYARKEVKDTLAICEQLRHLQNSLPILLVVGRYEITQGSAIKGIGNATFIIRPFDAKELGNKMAGLGEEL